MNMIPADTSAAAGGAVSEGTDGGPVGLLGVGLLGAALAERVLADGRPVIGFDVDAVRLDKLRRLGGQPAGDARQVAGACGVILLSLPTSATVAAVLEEIAPELSRRHVLIDTTTGSPADAREAARRVAARGAVYLDATVSGSSEQVRSGEAMVMVGGPEETVARCRGLLEALAPRVHHVGPTGLGSKMKLVTNLVLGLNRAALAEGLALAGALGLDLARTLAILRDSAAYSRMMDSKGPKMVTGDFTPQARLSQHLKDVRLILELAGEGGVRLPLSEAHRALLEQAEAAGWGGLDNSALLLALQPPVPRAQADRGKQG